MGAVLVVGRKNELGFGGSSSIGGVVPLVSFKNSAIARSEKWFSANLKEVLAGVKCVGCCSVGNVGTLGKQWLKIILIDSNRLVTLAVVAFLSGNAL